MYVLEIPVLQYRVGNRPLGTWKVSKRGKMVWSELRYSKTGARGKKRKYTHTHTHEYIYIYLKTHSRHLLYFNVNVKEEEKSRESG